MDMHDDFSEDDDLVSSPSNQNAALGRRPGDVRRLVLMRLASPHAQPPSLQHGDDAEQSPEPSTAGKGKATAGKGRKKEAGESRKAQNRYELPAIPRSTSP
jgi:hypothetical protein